MKWLVIGPYPVRNNGMSLYTDHLVAELRRQGQTVETELMYFWKEKWRNFRWYALRDRLKDGFDVVLIQHTPTASGPLVAPFLKAARQSGKKRIVECHETPDTYAKHLPGFLKGLYYAYERQVCDGASQVWVHTHLHRQALQDIGVENRIEVAPLPIYGDAVPPTDPSLRRDWGCYGMISRKKGVDLLLTAYQSRPAGHFPTLRILGMAAPGEERYVDELKAMVAPSHRDHIRFEGYIEDAQLPGVFATLATAIFPYRWVSQSAALAQACHFRVPYLASDIPYFREFQEQFGCGRLFAAQSPDSLQAELERLRLSPLTAEQLPFDALHEKLGLAQCVRRQIAWAADASK
jgi:glycosyltransferase involved in cell wall biosynthesis